MKVLVITETVAPSVREVQREIEDIIFADKPRYIKITKPPLIGIKIPTADQFRGVIPDKYKAKHNRRHG